MNPQDQNKMRWLRPAMNGDDDAVIQGLLASLPDTESLSADEMKRLDVARNYMAELFLRGVSLQRFYSETGLTGAPIDPKQPGMVRNPMVSDAIYFRLWHLDKNPSTAAAAIRNILAARKEQMQEEYRNWYVLQICIDVDNSDADKPYALDAGLTPKAVCMEVRLNQIESVFARIDATCAALSSQAHNQLRFTLGSWAQQEYEGMCKLNLFSKHLPFRMGTEWLLFKNIHRLSGKFAWVWRRVARFHDKREPN